MAETEENKGFFAKVFGSNKSKNESSCCAVELEAVPETETTQLTDKHQEKAARHSSPETKKQPA